MPDSYKHPQKNGLNNMSATPRNQNVDRFFIQGQGRLSNRALEKEEANPALNAMTKTYHTQSDWRGYQTSLFLKQREKNLSNLQEDLSKAKKDSPHNSNRIAGLEQEIRRCKEGIAKIRQEGIGKDTVLEQLKKDWSRSWTVKENGVPINDNNPKDAVDALLEREGDRAEYLSGLNQSSAGGALELINNNYRFNNNKIMATNALGDHVVEKHYNEKENIDHYTLTYSADYYHVTMQNKNGHFDPERIMVQKHGKPVLLTGDDARRFGIELSLIQVMSSRGGGDEEQEQIKQEFLSTYQPIFSVKQQQKVDFTTNPPTTSVNLSVTPNAPEFKCRSLSASTQSTVLEGDIRFKMNVKSAPIHRRRENADREHFKQGNLAEGRFASWEAYVASEGHGLSLKAANKKVAAGKQFITNIQNGGPIPGTREENMSNLMWYLAQQSIETGRPMDAGSYTISLGNKATSQALHDYFAGKNAKSHPIARGIGGFLLNLPTALLNIPSVLANGFLGLIGVRFRIPHIPPISSIIQWATGGKLLTEDRVAYGRGSTHFKKEVAKGNKGNHFGYDILHDRNQLPGKAKTVVFGLMGDRVYLKPEEHGMDPIHQPGEAFLHSTVGFGPSVAKRFGLIKPEPLNTGNGARNVERALKEHRVTDTRVIKAYHDALNQKKQHLLDKKIALLSSQNPPNKKALQKLDQEIIKLDKLIKAPSVKGNIPKLSKLILSGSGDKTQLAEINQQFKNNISRIYNSPVGTPQYGDEIALTFQENGMRATYTEVQPNTSKLSASISKLETDSRSLQVTGDPTSPLPSPAHKDVDLSLTVGFMQAHASAKATPVSPTAQAAPASSPAIPKIPSISNEATPDDPPTIARPGMGR